MPKTDDAVREQIAAAVARKSIPQYVAQVEDAIAKAERELANARVFLGMIKEESAKL